MLDRIVVKSVEPPKEAFKCAITTTTKQSTYDFITAEAAARNMTRAAFVREVFERLESGEF